MGALPVQHTAEGLAQVAVGTCPGAWSRKEGLVSEETPRRSREAREAVGSLKQCPPKNLSRAELWSCFISLRNQLSEPLQHSRGKCASPSSTGATGMLTALCVDNSPSQGPAASWSLTTLSSWAVWVHLAIGPINLPAQGPSCQECPGGPQSLRSP